jgi:hypothetical protein
MKKLLTTFLLTYATVAPHLEAVYSAPSFNFDLAAGYRQDHFRWRSRDPEVSDDLTESVTWKNLQIADFTGFATYTSCTGWYFRVNGDYGRIYDGHVKNKDYLQSGSGDTLFEVNKANGGKGEVFDVVGGVGYRFISNGGRLALAPLIGYIHSEQHLHIYDVTNTFILGQAPEGKIPGHSTYKTRWYGGFAAWDMLLDWSCDLKFFGTIQGQMGQYRGQAHWRARSDINGFINHKANYVGFTGTLGFLYRIFCNNSIGISGSYRNLWTHHGKQKTNRRVYLLDDFGWVINRQGEDHDFEQKFHARWRVWSVQGNWFIHY